MYGLALTQKCSLSQYDMEGRVEGKLMLLKNRREWSADGRMVHNVLRFRDYLNVRTREHRRALTRLVCSDHPLAVEQGRRRVPATALNWRICRFCRLQGAIETETHILIDCSSPLLEPLREEFMAAATRVVPALLHTRRNVTSLQLLLAILSRFKLVELVAQYT